MGNLVLSDRQFEFHSPTFDVAVHRTIKLKYQPNRFQVNGMYENFFNHPVYLICDCLEIRSWKFVTQNLHGTSRSNFRSDLTTKIQGRT